MPDRRSDRGGRRSRVRTSTVSAHSDCRLDARDPGSHALARNRAADEHDSPAMPREHASAGHRALDVELQSLVRQSHRLQGRQVRSDREATRSIVTVIERSHASAAGAHGTAQDPPRLPRGVDPSSPEARGGARHRDKLRRRARPARPRLVRAAPAAGPKIPASWRAPAASACSRREVRPACPVAPPPG